MFQGHRMFNSSKIDCLAGFTASDFFTGGGSRAAIHPKASFDVSRAKGKGVGRRTLRIVMHSREDLVGKNVVVVGLGVSGRAAVKLALARGADVLAVDTNENAQVPEVSASAGNRLRAELGPHKQASFQNASLLVLSPGVPATQPEVAAAIQAGVPAISELGFAAESLPESIRIAAVSGTNGKSTVTTFAGQLLHHAGVKTFVGGNPGNPLSEAALQCLAFPADDPPFQAAVVEVSSYQMELPGSFHPKVGVILNLTPDHLDRHKTFENYGLTKCRLFAQMDQSDVAIIPQADPFIRKLTAQAGNKGTRAWLGGLPGVQLDSQGRRAFVLVPTTGETAGLYLSALKAIGSHNAHNAGTAALLALALNLGVGEEGIQDAIPNLQPPPHRMEIVHQDKQGVLWVNDSKATNVEAAVVGISAIVGRKAVILLGGLAKVPTTGKLGFEQLVHVLDAHRAVILFGESGEQIEGELRDANVKIPFFRQASMKDAVDLARTLVEPGDVILLCPACASFDEFRNFEHRGQIFKDLATMSMV